MPARSFGPRRDRDDGSRAGSRDRSGSSRDAEPRRDARRDAGRDGGAPRAPRGVDAGPGSRPYRERAARRSEPDGRPEPSRPCPRGRRPGCSIRVFGAELRSLTIDTGETVARHLVAAGLLVDVEPRRALEHARFARSIAARVGSVREAVGGRRLPRAGMGRGVVRTARRAAHHRRRPVVGGDRRLRAGPRAS